MKDRQDWLHEPDHRPYATSTPAQTHHNRHYWHSSTTTLSSYSTSSTTSPYPSPSAASLTQFSQCQGQGAGEGEGSTIAFHFSLGDDEDHDNDDQWEDQTPITEEEDWQATLNRESQHPRRHAAITASLQHRNCGSSGQSSRSSPSPLAALLSLPLPSYEPLTPPGHRLQESGPNSPRLAHVNAVEKWKETSSYEGDTEDHNNHLEHSQQYPGLHHHHHSRNPFSTPSDDMQPDQPLSATLRRLGAKRKTVLMAETETDNDFKTEEEGEDCIFASQQERAFATGRFSSPLPEAVPISSGSRFREELRGSVPIPRIPSYVLASDPAPPAPSFSRSQPSGSTSRWTRLADGWGGLLPPRDWFSSLTLGPLRSPSAPKSKATATPDHAAEEESRPDDEGDPFGSAYTQTSLQISEAEEGKSPSTMKKKHKSLLLHKLRKLAEEDPPPTSVPPLPASSSSGRDRHPLQRSQRNVQNISKSDEDEDREDLEESAWEDIWTRSETNGVAHAHQLLNHLLETPLVESDSDKDRERSTRRVRFASFMPTLKQATKIQLSECGSAAAALEAEARHGQEMRTGARSGNSHRATKRSRLPEAQDQREGEGERERLSIYAANHLLQRAASWKSTTSSAFVPASMKAPSVSWSIRGSTTKTCKKRDIEMAILPCYPPRASSDSKKEHSKGSATKERNEDASSTSRLRFPLRLPSLSATTTGQRINSLGTTLLSSSTHPRRPCRLPLLLGAGILLLLLLTILALSVILALSRSQLTRTQDQLEACRLEGENVKETLRRLAAQLNAYGEMDGL